MANLKDFATGTVLSAPSPATSGTQLTLQSGEGTRMPTPPFYATAHPDYQLPTLDNAEVILVTNITVDTLTFTRAQKTTSAKSIATGWRISNAVFKDDLYQGSLVSNEVPSGSVNGSNTAFTVASAFTSGSLRVFLNGQRLKSGSGNDYTENSSLTGFTMEYAPATGDVLLVDYTIGSSVVMNGTDVRINQETPSGNVNGSNTAYTLSRGYVSGTLEVYINGVLQAPTTHVTEVSPSAGTFSLDTAPLTGDVVRVSYLYAASAGGNAASVNGYVANATATANQIPVLDGNGYLPSSTMDAAWQSYVPSTINNFTVGGSGTRTFSYKQLGKRVYVRVYGLLASGFSIGDILFSLPVARYNHGPATNILGDATLIDSGTQAHYGKVEYSTVTGLASIRAQITTGTPASVQRSTITSTSPFTWAVGDYVTAEFEYEAA